MSPGRIALALLASLWLAGCNQSSISIEPTSLDFKAAQGSSAPPAQVVKATFTGAGVVVGFPPAMTPPSWLDISNAGSDQASASFSFRITMTSLSPDTYRTTVRFVTGKEDGTDLQFVDMPVTYTVSPPPKSLSISPQVLSFSASSGQTALPAPTSMTATGDEAYPVSFSVTASYSSSPQGWLTLPPPGTTPQTFTVGPNTTALPPGQYSALLRFTPSNGQATIQIPVTYSVGSPPFSVTPARVEFASISGQSALPLAQTLNVSTQSGQPTNYGVAISYAGAQRDWLTAPATGTTPQSATLRPNTTALPPGQYTATVTFTPGNGMPAFQATVVYTVSAPRLTVSPTQLSFTAANGQTPLPTAQSVNVTADPSQTPIHYTVTATYSGPQRDWMTVPAAASTPQALALSPNTTALPAGQYSAVLTFTPDNGQPAVTVSVTYTVSASDLRVNPSAPTLRVDASTQESALTNPIALTSTGAPFDWRVVSVNGSWMDATPASGNTQSQPGLSLVLSKSALATLENGSYTGTLTLAYGTATTAERQVDITVKLTVALPRVRIITPYFIEAGRSLSHVLRGDGFSGLPAGLTVRFGDTTTSTYQVISDSELRLTVPALPEGTHAVTVDNALGLARPGVNLYAVRTPTLPEVNLARTRGVRRVIYDPRRLAIYTVDYNNSNGVNAGLYRYRYVNGAWTEDAYVTLPNIYDAVMDVDGQSLYMPIGTGLYRLDLDDPTATPQYIKANWGQYNQIEVQNDGGLVDLGGSCYHGTTSLDGRRTLIMDAGCYSPPSSVRARDAGSTQVQSSSLSTYGPSSWIALDRTARYAFVQNAIYNAQWALVADATNLYEGIFSHDARRFFALYDDSAQSKQLLRAYDVSGPPSGGRFPKLAEIPVTGASTGDGAYGGGGKVLTPDDHTLIIVNSRQFHVIPVPASMQ